MKLVSSHPVRSTARSVAARLGALALGLTTLAGCQLGETNNAQLRVIDASPDAGPIDTYQNNTGVAYNLGFGSLTSYVAMTPGNYTLTADKSGTRQTLLSNSVTLLAGHQYTQIVSNVAANLQQTVLQDQTTPAPAGQIELRFVQDATHSGPVDIYLVPSGGRPTQLVNNLLFGRTAGYLTVPAGTYAIDIVPAGKVLTASTVTLESGSQVEYDSGAVRTVVLIDEEAPGPQQPYLTTGVQTLSLDDADSQ
jgi:hypothetical protein